MAKTDNSTGVDWNDIMTNECERVGVVNSPLRGRPETASPGFYLHAMGARALCCSVRGAYKPISLFLELFNLDDCLLAWFPMPVIIGVTPSIYCEIMLTGR